MKNADFPLNEYAQRCENAQRLMEREDLDALIINSAEDLTYFSGFLKPHLSKRRPYFFVLPREAPATLIIPFTMRGNAEEMTWLSPDGMRLWGGPLRLGLPSDSIEVVISLIKDHGLAKKRIGLELGRSMQLEMTPTDLEIIKRELPQAQFVDATALIWKLRMIKSPREIDHLKKSCDITCKALELGIQLAKEGMTEREFTRIVYKAMLDEGGEDHPLRLWQQVRSGPERYRVDDARPSDKKMNRGDLVVVDLGAFYRGYYTDMIRMFCIGTPSAKQKDMFEVALQAQVTGVNALKPGAKMIDIYSRALNVIEEAGYIENTIWKTVGHGLGMEVHEPPTIGPAQAEEILRPGMVVTMEPAIYDPPANMGEPGGVGAFLVEDDVLITETGREILTPMKKDLWIV